MFEGDVEFFVRIMRMRAHRAVDIVEPLRDGFHLVEFPDARRNRHERADASRMRTRDDVIQLWRKIGKIEMTMMIDKHQTIYSPAPLKRRAARCPLIPAGRTAEKRPAAQES